MNDFTGSGKISKLDEDKRQAFGWASVTDVNGQPVVDRQSDVIDTEELEKAAYAYVLDSRVGGTMHERVGKAGPRKVATLIESFVVTPEKVEKMGLPPNSIPSGWWVGFKVHDDEVWKDVKSGKLDNFSVHGSGKRKKSKMAKRDERAWVLETMWQRTQDPVAFTKAVATFTDELAEHGHQEAAFFGEVAKHLIGQHDQDSHARSSHEFSGSDFAANTVGGALGGGAGGAIGGKITGGRTGRYALAGAIGGGLMGALQGSQSDEDEPDALEYLAEQHARDEAMENTSKRLDRPEIVKHLIGQHEQKDHSPGQGEHTRSEHGNAWKYPVGLGAIGTVGGGAAGAAAKPNPLGNALARSRTKSGLMASGLGAIAGTIAGTASGATIAGKEGRVAELSRSPEAKKKMKEAIEADKAEERRKKKRLEDPEERKELASLIRLGEEIERERTTKRLSEHDKDILRKHLIGQHEQKDHDPTERDDESHSRSEHTGILRRFDKEKAQSKIDAKRQKDEQRASRPPSKRQQRKEFAEEYNREADFINDLIDRAAKGHEPTSEEVERASRMLGPIKVDAGEEGGFGLFSNE